MKTSILYILAACILIEVPASHAQHRSYVTLRSFAAPLATRLALRPMK